MVSIKFENEDDYGGSYQMKKVFSWLFVTIVVINLAGCGLIESTDSLIEKFENDVNWITRNARSYANNPSGIEKTNITRNGVLNRFNNLEKTMSILELRQDQLSAIQEGRLNNALTSLETNIMAIDELMTWAKSSE